MVSDTLQSNQVNLTVVALVALVAIVGLVALVINVSTPPAFQVSTGSGVVSAAGDSAATNDAGDAVSRRGYCLGCGSS
jgi:hypothetical protein